MKKYIINIIVFFIFIVAFDFIYGRLIDYMKTNAKSGATKQLFDLCTKDQYDLLIMGSSKAHHNYNTNVFCDSLGINCYNAGYDGNGIILAYGILSLIDNSRSPKMILYDVKQQFDIYKYNGDNDYTRYYQKLKTFYGNPVIDDIIGSISYIDLIKLNSSLYRTNGNFFNIVQGFINESHESQDLGFQPVYGTITNDDEQVKDYSEEIDSLKIKYFRSFIELTKVKNIELIVVLSPEYNTSLFSDFQPVRDLCYFYNVKVLDYLNNPSLLKKEYYKDHCHMNEDGARVYSAALAHDIKLIINKIH